MTNLTKKSLLAILALMLIFTHDVHAVTATNLGIEQPMQNFVNAIKYIAFFSCLGFFSIKAGIAFMNERADQGIRISLGIVAFAAIIVLISTIISRLGIGSVLF